MQLAISRVLTLYFRASRQKWRDWGVIIISIIIIIIIVVTNDNIQVRLNENVTGALNIVHKTCNSILRSLIERRLNIITKKFTQMINYTTVWRAVFWDLDEKLARRQQFWLN